MAKQYPQPYLRGKYYHFSYYKNKKRFYKSTRTTVKKDARGYIQNFINKLELTDETLKGYCLPFFLWDECPHVQRLLQDEGKSMGRSHVRKCRSWLESYILTDPIVNLKISEINRGDVLDFRTRLLKRLGNKRNTINKTMSTLKTIFSEALFREDIKYNPAARVGKIAEDREEPGIFSADELKALFPLDNYGPWQGLKDYAVFLMAATIGMRRGEILALQWRYVDLENRVVDVQKAWKSATEIGAPKWNKLRAAPLPAVMAEVLKRILDDSIRTAPEDLVFCYDNGQRLGNTWWQNRFSQAMEKSGLDSVGRRLKPHSFRHTLNTLLIEAEKSPEKIRASLGWSSERIQQNYTHLKVDGLRDQADLVDDIFEK